MHFFNPAPVHAAGRDRERPRHRSGGRATRCTRPPPHGASRRCTRPRRRASSSTAARARSTPRRWRAARRARGGSRDARRRDARGGRLPHGPVRADGPDRPRRELRGHPGRVGGLLPRPALHARRWRSASWSPPASSDARSGRGFYAYGPERGGAGARHARARAPRAAARGCGRRPRSGRRRSSSASRGAASPSSAAPPIPLAGRRADVAGEACARARATAARRRSAPRRAACATSSSFDLALDFAACTRAGGRARGRLQRRGVRRRRRAAAGGRHRGLAAATTSPACRCCAPWRCWRTRRRTRSCRASRRRRDIDLAMRKGVNYPRGPLAWADALGVARVRAVLRASARPLRRRPLPRLAADRAPCATGARSRAERIMGEHHPALIAGRGAGAGRARGRRACARATTPRRRWASRIVDVGAGLREARDDGAARHAERPRDLPRRLHLHAGRQRVRLRLQQLQPEHRGLGLQRSTSSRRRARATC